MSKSVKHLTAYLSLILWLFAFAFGVWFYPGGKLNYVFFSFVFLGLISSIFYSRKYYGYTFLSIFLWLGFWLKTTAHLILNYPYSEPAGGFSFSPGSWDSVLNISSIGALGLLLSLLVYRVAFGIHFSGKMPIVTTPPPWYSYVRKWLWMSFLIAVVLFSGLNFFLGIHQVGLIPRTVLFWPGNAVIAWFLNIGLAMSLAALIRWDILLGETSLYHFLAISLESSFSTVSILSRGSFVYHGIPLFFASFRTNVLPGIFSKAKLTIIGFVFFASFIASLFSVNVCRRLYYTSVPIVKYAHVDLLHDTIGLIVDRWVGVEGVMSLNGYEAKDLRLLRDAFFEVRAEGKPLLYESISNSHYQKIDRTKYQFASIPGPVAFFYYSGINWIVFAGVFVLGFFVLSIEHVVYLVSKNPFMCAIVGMMVANNAAQFGTAPGQMLPTYSMVFIALVLLWLVENKLTPLFNYLKVGKK